MSAVEIIPNLWLGNIKASLDLEFIKAKGIKCIINCTKNCNFAEGLPVDVKKIRLLLSDTGTDEAREHMSLIIPKATKFIYRELIKGNVVLVHCYAGKQRSVAIIAAFLMDYAKYTSSEALKRLYKKWPHYPDRYTESIDRHMNVC